MSTPVLAPRVRITGAARQKLAAELAARYEAGESIRQLCAATGYSIGRVRGLLINAEVTFRARGGRRLLQDS
jgi:hypothetical protein